MKDSIIAILAELFTVLLRALICLLAWNGFAYGFNLPTFSYWHWIVTFIAIRALFGNKAKGK